MLGLFNVDVPVARPPIDRSDQNEVFNAARATARHFAHERFGRLRGLLKVHGMVDTPVGPAVRFEFAGDFPDEVMPKRKLFTTGG